MLTILSIYWYIIIEVKYTNSSTSGICFAKKGSMKFFNWSCHCKIASYVNCINYMEILILVVHPLIILAVGWASTIKTMHGDSLLMFFVSIEFNEFVLSLTN